MKAAQIQKYTQALDVQINEIPKPEPTANEVLIQVKYAAVNPLDLMNIDGSVKLIQSYSMPLTLGNEVSGEVAAVGAQVSRFHIGDQVYSRLPLNMIGGFAEYVAVDQAAIWFIPQHLSLKQAAAVPLTGLTAYQGLTEELQIKPGQTLFIPGGSGSFGQMAVPLAKQMGVNVIVSGNALAKARIMALGATRYLDYRKEDYWTVLEPVDAIIDTRGAKELPLEMRVLKPGGRLLSLIAGPNKQFAVARNLPFWKTLLFGLAGYRFDRLARQHHRVYRFIFVRADGRQLQQITSIVETNHIVPAIDARVIDLDHINDALQLVAHGRLTGKVVVAL
ncbi:NADP-dependent oxidoreductase [Lacticaseibacillus nasuensis]|nr:NADP-dependent oxidoreductase [Lacticaseibacillus nasuensis]